MTDRLPLDRPILTTERLVLRRPSPRDAAAIVTAVIVMMFFAGPLSRFVDANPTIKMLALAFLVLIGGVLVLEGVDVHVDKAYVYTAMGFSVAVEFLNLRMRRKMAELSASALR